MSCSKNTWSTVAEGDGTVYKLTDACAALFDCAVGSYCPAGSFSGRTPRPTNEHTKTRAGTEEDAAAYFAEAWWPSGRGGVDCEVVAGHDADVFAYQCACGNGFWCGANTALPKFCPKGYFCETPASLEKCPEGSYCKEGSVEAAKCSNLQDCPKGSAVPEATASARRRPPSVGSGRGAGRAALGEFRTHGDREAGPGGARGSGCPKGSRRGLRSGARTSEA